MASQLEPGQKESPIAEQSPFALKKKKSWYDRVSRITTSNQFIPEVDGLRFIAIITVVLLHTNTHLLRINGTGLVEEAKSSTLYLLVQQGGLGVLVFFAISGFILALPFAKSHLLGARRPDLKSYFMRRLTRLEPPYIATLLLFFAAIVVSGQATFTELLPNFWASLFYLHFFIFGIWSPINPVTWSLETEVQFYVLAPFLSYFFAIKHNMLKWGLLAIVALAIPAFHQLYVETVNDWHLGKSILVLLPFFLVGFVLAEFYLKHPSFFKGKSHWWDLLGLISMIGLYLGNSPYLALPKYLFLVSCALLFVAAFKGKLLNLAMRHPFIATTGGMCYTIYLLHYPIIAMVGKVFAPPLRGFHYEAQYAIFLLLTLPIIYGLSAVFFILLEKPCMDKNWPTMLKNYFSNLGRRGVVGH